MRTASTVFFEMAKSYATLAIICLLMIEGSLTFAQNAPSPAPRVPRLVSFNGVLKDAGGVPRVGVVGVRFAIYGEETGGTPLWQEVQNVQLDSQGRYLVSLGSAEPEGVPPELFVSGEPRWLGVQPLFPGEQEQPRVLLVSVPYAMKAGDADTLGGLPPTAFLQAAQASSALALPSFAVPVSPAATATVDSNLGASTTERTLPTRPRPGPSTTGICYANDYPGVDIFAEFNSALAACGHGEIRIRQGTYGSVKTTANLTQPADSMVCEGTVTINYTGTGDAINWRMIPFTIAPAGRIEGCQIVGTSSGASGIHMGDIVGWTLHRFVVSGFTGTGASGIWWDNRTGWIERGTMSPSVAANNNSIGFRMTNNGTTELTSSFCYDRVLGLALQVEQNQIGISTESGKFCHGTMIATINSMGSNKTLISLSGPALWQDGFYQITTEDDGTGGTRLSIGPNASLTGIGMFDHYGTSVPMTDSISGGLYLYLPHLNAIGMWSVDQHSDLQIQAFPGATSSSNVSAPFIEMKGNYWNGTTTAPDSVIIHEVLGTGVNPSSTYTISHAGSTGPFGLLLDDGSGQGLYLSASGTSCSSASCIRHDSANNLILDTSGNGSLYLNSDNNRPIQTGTGTLILKGHLGQTLTGGDLAGTIAITAGVKNDLTFVKAFNSPPVCTLTPATSVIQGSVWWVTSTPVSLTAHVSPQQTVDFNYHCIGKPD